MDSIGRGLIEKSLILIVSLLSFFVCIYRSEWTTYSDLAAGGKQIMKLAEVALAGFSFFIIQHFL